MAEILAESGTNLGKQFGRVAVPAPSAFFQHTVGLSAVPKAPGNVPDALVLERKLDEALQAMTQLSFHTHARVNEGRRPYRSAACKGSCCTLGR